MEREESVRKIEQERLIWGMEQHPPELLSPRPSAGVRLLAVLALLVTTTVAWGFPTSSNIIPTADMLEVGSLRIEIENDGAPQLFGPADESYMLLECAPHPRLELGVDLYSVGSSNDIVFNGKWLACPEKPGRPAVAVGCMELGSGFSSSTYLVATKDIGQGLRLHFGGAASAGSRAALFGVEKQIGEKDYLLADWASWSVGYSSLGIYHEIRPGVAVNLAYALPNTRSESNLVILNVAWTHPLR
jgi:hypothetical protein